MSEDPGAVVAAAPQDTTGAPAAASAGAPASTEGSGGSGLLEAAGDLLETVVSTGVEDDGRCRAGLGQ